MSDRHRFTAEVDWDANYGDRHTALSFVGLRLDVPSIARLLAACLLTDAEVADGMDAWRTSPAPSPISSRSPTTPAHR